MVRDAGLYALQWFRKLDSLKTEKKGPQDLVSKADREVENMIRERLQTLFPEDGFLGEESGTRNLDAEGIWIVDPIDGTICFLNGLSSWCVSIAFVVKNQIEIGLIYAPCMDELFAAQLGAGATLNGKPMKPSKATSLADGIVGLGYSPKSSIVATQKAFDYLFKNGGVYHDVGSAALMLAYVAAGRYIGVYEFQINSWDCLAGIAMVRETGGWTNDFLANDGLLTGNPVLVAAPGVKDAMQKLFAAAGH
ncbi:MAG: inositol monophosphatase [SAR324 cluster bacterium]|uniref:Inositol-1-monophosphatase n=1 Tax=SAR324 cluster bacterium TaxID=2024889 RepID=A0A432GHS7_9DELT|nr:MAG: inositol monophosphatase [SAR324 cluster bacterium]